MVVGVLLGELCEFIDEELVEWLCEFKEELFNLCF